MRKYIFSIFLSTLFFAGVLPAQDPVCVPDLSYADSLAGVYPGPFHPELFPDGGIHDTACINHPFELVLTAVVQDSITFGGLQLKLNYLQIAQNGVLNMPEGFSYACNPPNCKFESNTIGCMLISGTPTEANEPGVFDLKLKSQIVALNGLININDTLPEFLIPGSHYYLVLDPENSIHCQSSSVSTTPLDKPGLELVSNPVSDRIRVRLDLKESSSWQLDLVDMYGQKIDRITGSGGSDTEDYEMGASQLLPGYYFLRLTTSRGMVVRKLLVIND